MHVFQREAPDNLFRLAGADQGWRHVHVPEGDELHLGGVFAKRQTYSNAPDTRPEVGSKPETASTESSSDGR